jgi:3-hydroxyisobutyrate dehydrogenase
LRICSETAREIGAKLPVTHTVAGFYDEISKLSGGRWDTSSLIRRLRKT